MLTQSRIGDSLRENKVEWKENCKFGFSLVMTNDKFWTWSMPLEHFVEHQLHY